MILSDLDLIESSHDEDGLVFNPLGPPTKLAALSVGDTLFATPGGLGGGGGGDDTQQHADHGPITRLSQSPDVFLIQGLLPSKQERDTILRAAKGKGMKIAGTRKSGTNTVRKNSFLTWIDPYDLQPLTLDHDDEDSQEDNIGLIVRKLATSARQLFAHKTMNALYRDGEYKYCHGEDLQVAKYDAGGFFECHHDGYGRFLTILTYQNGVGGTYFPLANVEQRNVIVACQKDALEVALNCVPGRDGLLLVGKEGMKAYTTTVGKHNHCRDGGSLTESVVEIYPGDAIAFYNYQANGQEDWKSLHGSLTVPEEKWIATNWFRSEALTGRFAALHKAELATAQSSVGSGAEASF